MIVLIFFAGVAFIIIGLLQINKKMIPYYIEVVIEGETLYKWLKTNGLINIGWGCVLILLSIATLFIKNGYIWTFVLITSFIIKTIANYRNNRKYIL